MQNSKGANVIAASGLLLLAGVLHLVALPERYAAMPALGVLFFVLAALQIGAGSLFLLVKKHSRTVSTFVIFLNAFLILLWIITQLLQQGNEPITFLNMVRKISELIVIALLWADQRHPKKASSDL